MTGTAYLLAFVRDDRIVGFAIFGEEHPTHVGPGRYLTVTSARASSYADAVKAVASTGPMYGRGMGPACLKALERLASEPFSRGVEIDRE